jgi:hypothetical protein
LFSFAKKLGIDEDGTTVFPMLSSITILLAYLTWKYIELPFRLASRISRRAILSISIVFSLVFITIGVLVEINNGFPNRVSFNPSNKVDELSLRAVFNQYGFRSYPTPMSLKKDPSSGLMKMGSGIGKSVLLIGDSHSIQYWNTFDDFYSRSNIRGYEKSLYVQVVPFLPDLDKLILKNDIDVVVISYFWSLHYGSPSVNQFIRCCGHGPKGVVGVQNAPSSEEVMNSYDQTLSRLIKQLRNRSIRTIIVLDNPFGEELNPQSMLRLDRLNVYPTEKFTDLSRKLALSRTEPVRSRLINLAKNYGAEIVDPFNYLCDEVSCKAIAKDGYMMYKDYDHISLQAVTKDASYILKVLE